LIVSIRLSAVFPTTTKVHTTLPRSHAPVAALETTNAEALRATPQENVRDALEKHKPLDGVAIVPPGEPDRLGRTYNYEEGTDMMREGLNGEPGYKQWSGKVRCSKEYTSAQKQH
jgi:hypothetical protein